MMQYLRNPYPPNAHQLHKQMCNTARHIIVPILNTLNSFLKKQHFKLLLPKINIEVTLKLILFVDITEHPLYLNVYTENIIDLQIKSIETNNKTLFV